MEVDCPDSTKIRVFMIIIVVFVTEVYQYSESNPLAPTPFPSILQSRGNSLLGNMTLLFFLPLPSFALHFLLLICFLAAKIPVKLNVCMYVFVRGTHPDKVVNTTVAYQMHSSMNCIH